MRHWGVVFPGQGAQFSGMGRSVAKAYPIARQTFEEASDLVNMDLASLAFEGPMELLTQTKYSQMALLTVSVALWRVLMQERPWIPGGMAGLSLGEYSALVAAGVVSFDEALLLVQKRATFMHEACEQLKGGMAAVLFLDPHTIEEVVDPIDQLWVANYNTPDQTVISGTLDALEQGSQLLKQKGAKKIIPLQVHGAFHSGLMESARLKLAPWIDQLSLKLDKVPLFMNVTGNEVKSDTELKKNLKDQMTGSVRWWYSIQEMQSQGVIGILEVGAGKTLTSMNQKIGVKHAISFSEAEDLGKVMTKFDEVL